MALYRNTITGEIRELDDALISSWEAAGNPKRQQWEAYTPPPPEPPAPPEPAADWARFRDEVLNSKELLQVLGEATQHPDGEVRARASMLVPLYLLAEGNGVGPFRDAWRHLVMALPVPAEIVEGAITAATNCNLPEEFIQALQPEA